MRHLLIQSEDDKKGRSFRAELLAYARADSLWELGQNADRETVRPIFCMLACSEAEASPVIANLRLGRKAKLWEHKYGREKEESIVFEFLKSAKYEIKPQRHPEGVIVTLYLHEHIRHDVAMVDPSGVKFALLPAVEWLAPPQPEAEAHVARWVEACIPKPKDRYATAEPRPTPEDIATITRSCYLFAKQVFARANGPIPKDARFFSQALMAMLAQGLASFSAERSSGWERGFGKHSALGFETWGLERVGIAPGICVKADHAAIEKLLAEQVEIYYGMVKE